MIERAGGEESVAREWRERARGAGRAREVILHDMAQQTDALPLHTMNARRLQYDAPPVAHAVSCPALSHPTTHQTNTLPFFLSLSLISILSLFCHARS